MLSDSVRQQQEQAEQAVLGAIMTYPPDQVGETIAKLKPGDFFNPRHETIFHAAAALFSRDRATDPASLNAELASMGATDKVGGAPYLFEIYEQAPPAGAVQRSIESVLEASARRRLMDTAITIRNAVESGRPIEEALEEAQKAIDGMAAQDESTLIDTEAGIAGVLDYVDAAMRGETSVAGVMSGYTQLDEVTNGFKPGQLIIVAARPGVGKSTLATDIMRAASIRQGVPSLLFSLEMSGHEVYQRILSAESDVRLSKIIRGAVTNEERGALQQAYERIKSAPILVEDSPDLTLMDIRAKTKLEVKRRGIGLVLVDYLQLLKSGGKVESRQQEVSDISRSLKLLSKACGVPVIALAQLNRGVERRGDDAVPKPSDLRESGSLEQDADMVILIHRPEVNNPDHETSGEASLILAKHRGGQLTTVPIYNQLYKAKFSNEGHM